MAQVRFPHVSSEEWLTQIVKSHHHASSACNKAIPSLQAMIQMLLLNLLFSFRSYHALTFPWKPQPVCMEKSHDWIWWAGAWRSSLCHWMPVHPIYKITKENFSQEQHLVSGLLQPGGHWATDRDFAKLEVSSEPLWRVWSCFVKRCVSYLLTYFTLVSVHVGKRLPASVCLNLFLLIKEI